MISATQFQNAYNDFYAELYRFIWEIQTVEKIADLEVSIYQVFPRIDEIERCYKALVQDIKSTDAWEDEELRESAQALEDLIHSDDVQNGDSDFYSDIVSFQGVVSNDDQD